ncbi:iron-containing alcohol dehydrogenase [Candidatus Aerophobetes bacterium]|nr:iron-containing alcohol dehydrogenase [Candidatus Aerophobetes bacterium]
MLPYVVKFNITGNLSKFSKIATIMGENIEGLGREEAAEKAVGAVRAIVTDVGLPKRLREVGIPKHALPGITESASQVT